jgi:hypothetical protein
MENKRNYNRKKIGVLPIFKQCEKLYNILKQCGDKNRQLKIINMVKESLEGDIDF